MNGFVRKTALVIGCTLGAAVVGCDTLPKNCTDGGAGAGLKPTAQELTSCSNQLYDRCWPERYNNLAIREVNRASTPQVLNGHVLDQTVWNHHFEPGSDRLNAAGQATLQYLSRRRPCPDTTVYLATALDLPYDPGCPDRYCGARQELDSLRAAAIQKYLVGLNCGRPTEFQVCVHDPADVSIATVPAASSVIQMYARYRGGLGVGAGVAGGAAGGAAAAGVPGASGAGTGTIR
jgi:hypothetical protein